MAKKHQASKKKELISQSVILLNIDLIIHR